MGNKEIDTWWQSIDKKCLDYGISQSRLAMFADMDRRHLLRLRKGETPFTEKHRHAIESAVEKLNPNTPLSIIIDYVRIRFKTIDFQKIICNVLKLNINYMIHEDYAHNGYEERFRFGDIEISISSNISLGVLLEMKGSGCRHFEGVLEAQNRDWYDFFGLAWDTDGIFKRLDLAINDIHGILDIAKLTKKLENKEYISLFKSFEHCCSGRLSGEDHCVEMGETLYIGSRKSEIYFCVYEKDYEQYIKKGVPLEEAPIKNRFEIRLKNKRADAAVYDLLCYRDIDETVFSIINQYITFVSSNSAIPVYDRDTDKQWNYFTGEHRKKLQLTTKPEKFSLERTKNWINRQVVPSLKALIELDRINGTQEVKQMFDNAKLSEKYRKLIMQQEIPIEEMLKTD